MSTSSFSRRSFLGALGVGAAASVAAASNVFAQPGAPSSRGSGGKPKTLVVVLQRGAVDGLSMVVPYAEKVYYEARPSIAIPAPGSADGATKLDAIFGLHPALAGLLPFWQQGSLAAIHSVGSPDTSRSHFDAQDYLESGTPGVKGTGDGWLNRALGSILGGAAAGKLNAISLTSNAPRIFLGNTETLSFPNLNEFRITGGHEQQAEKAFRAMYAGAIDPTLKETASEGFAALDEIGKIKKDSFPARNGASFPGSPLGTRMRQISQLIQADLGVRVFFTDCGGWDTHTAQGDAKGGLAKKLEDLGNSLGAFATDLKDQMSDVCVVTATEFGRTVHENGTGGTDHGHGSAMFVLGGGVRGQRVYADWKGLDDANLFENRDLAVTTDHRQVFSEILAGHLGVTDPGKIFPSFTPGKNLGLFG